MVKSKVLNNIQIPVSGEGPRGETGRIGYLLRQASVAHRLRVEKILAEFDLTLPQYSVLSFCLLYPGLSNADLARLTLLTPQTVSTIVSNLERKGMIVRHAHAIHGRIQHIDLSAEARALLKKCDKPVLKLQEELVEGLSPKEEKIVRQWLINLAKSENL